jgi:hypothetical protein
MPKLLYPTHKNTYKNVKHEPKKPHETNINYEKLLIWVGYDFRNP